MVPDQIMLLPQSRAFSPLARPIIVQMARILAALLLRSRVQQRR
jgi:hypothetical protein